MALTSTTGDWGFGKNEIGSSGRTRTYNPSVNSRAGCSRLTLQTQPVAGAKMRFSEKLGGLCGDWHICATSTFSAPAH